MSSKGKHMKLLRLLEGVDELPKATHIRRAKGKWVVELDSPRQDVINAFGGMMILAVGSFIGTGSFMVDVIRSSHNWGISIGYGIIVFVMFLFVLAASILFGQGLRVYGQKLQLELYPQYFTLTQKTLFYKQQAKRQYSPNQIKKFVHTPIKKSLVNIHTHSGQQSLHLVTTAGTRKKNGWGYYLSNEQLKWVEQLILQGYQEHKIALSLAKPKKQLDLSTHLLET